MGKMRGCGMLVGRRVNCGVKVRGLTQALITVDKTNTSPTNPNPNLTNTTYSPPPIFSPAFVSRILPISTFVSRREHFVDDKLA